MDITNKQTTHTVRHPPTQTIVFVSTMAGKSKSGTKGKSGAKGGFVLKTAMSAHNNPAARVRIPQTIGLPGQIANNAGGYSFPLPLEQE